MTSIEKRIVEAYFVVLGLALLYFVMEPVIAVPDLQNPQLTSLIPIVMGTHDVAESSGVVASRNYSSIYWMIADSGNPEKLYAVNATGGTVNVFNVTNATNVDWEDMALDDDNNVWIADTGDNSHVRDYYTLYKVSEPDPYGPSINVSATAYNFTYPNNDNRDSEAIFVWNRTPYVMQKRLTSSTVYKFLELNESKTVELAQIANFVRGVNLTGNITGVDISRDGRRLVVINDLSDFHWVIERDAASTNVSDFFYTPTNEWYFKFGNMQGEAIAFVNGTHDLVVASEQGNFWNITQNMYETAQPITQPPAEIVIPKGTIYLFKPGNMTYATSVPILYNIVNGTECNHTINGGAAVDTPCKYSSLKTLEVGSYLLNVSAKNNETGESMWDIRYFTVTDPDEYMIYSEFSGKGQTTNLASLTDPENATFFLHQPNYGKIKFEEINFTEANGLKNIVMTWDAWDYDSVNESTVIVNGQNATRLPSTNIVANNQKYAQQTLDITNKVVSGVNTVLIVQNIGEAKVKNVTFTRNGAVLMSDPVEVYMWPGGLNTVAYTFKNVPAYDIDSAANISSKKITVDSAKFPWLNKKATITFEKINLENPVILKDGAVCTDCVQESYNKTTGLLTYIVQGFSTYTVVDNSELAQPPASSSGSSSGGGGSSTGGSPGPSAETVTINENEVAEEVAPTTELEETPACVENWVCTDWSGCASGTQTRDCIDSNYCGSMNSQPASSQSCVETSTQQPTAPTGLFGLAQFPISYLYVLLGVVFVSAIALIMTMKPKEKK